MANSKYEYVRHFENEPVCLPNSYIVVRIDGKNFSKFTDAHKFVKPNDIRALELMNRAASEVMEEFNEIVLAYGQSDEYSFVFRKSSQAFNRRAYKLLSNVNSLFASAYVFHWSEYFVETRLQYPPAFDARIVLYPSDENLKDYLAWRQVDVHINNLYNTCFWNLVQRQNMTPVEAQEKLKGSVSSDKHEILFKDFGINYNDELPMFKRGTTLLRGVSSNVEKKITPTIIQTFEDIIVDEFWKKYPEILAPKLSKTQEKKQNWLNNIQKRQGSKDNK